MAKQAPSVKHPHIHKPAHHFHKDLFYGCVGDSLGMCHHVFRTGYGVLGAQTLCIMFFIAKAANVLRHASDIAVVIKGITRTTARKEAHDGMPPNVRPRVAAHLLNTWIGELAEPVVKFRPAMLQRRLEVI